MRRFASGGPYGKLEGVQEGVKKSLHQLQKKLPKCRFQCGNVQAVRTMMQHMRYSDSTKCNSSTAENSPKRSCISFSFHSRKIHPVILWSCPPPPTKWMRPR